MIKLTFPKRSPFYKNEYILKTSSTIEMVEIIRSHFDSEIGVYLNFTKGCLVLLGTRYDFEYDEYIEELKMRGE